MLDVKRLLLLVNFFVCCYLVWFLAPSVRAFTCDLLQRKVKGLEDDNRKLRAEASQLVRESSESELREEQLLQDVLAQLGLLSRLEV